MAAAARKKLVVERAYCTRAAGSDCERCAACCPKEAIALPPGQAAPEVDHDACTGCGICFGVCDAFASTRMTAAQLHERLLRIATQGRRVYLTCKENVFPGFEVDDNVVVLPCLSMLSPEFWTLLLAENVRISVACDFKYCEDCERAGGIGGELFTEAIETAQAATDAKVLFSYRIPEKGRAKHEVLEHADRRHVFAGALADVAEVASGKRRLRNSEVLADYVVRRERRRAADELNVLPTSGVAALDPTGDAKRTLFPKRRLVLESISRRPDIADRIPVLLSVTADEFCEGAGACAARCPTGARTIDAATGKPQVAVAYCIGCGICYDACPNGAVGIDEATAAYYLPNGEQERP